MVKTTTIQIPSELRSKLEGLKDYSRETYADVIEKLVDIVTEEQMELSEETKKAIEESRKQIKEGKFVTLEQLKKEFKLK